MASPSLSCSGPKASPSLPGCPKATPSLLCSGGTVNCSSTPHPSPTPQSPSPSLSNSPSQTCMASCFPVPPPPPPLSFSSSLSHHPGTKVTTSFLPSSSSSSSLSHIPGPILPDHEMIEIDRSQTEPILTSNSYIASSSRNRSTSNQQSDGISIHPTSASVSPASSSSFSSNSSSPRSTSSHLPRATNVMGQSANASLQQPQLPLQSDSTVSESRLLSSIQPINASSLPSSSSGSTLSTARLDIQQRRRLLLMQQRELEQLEAQIDREESSIGFSTPTHPSPSNCNHLNSVVSGSTSAPTRVQPIRQAAEIGRARTAEAVELVSRGVNLDRKEAEDWQAAAEQSSKAKKAAAKKLAKRQRSRAKRSENSSGIGGENESSSNQSRSRGESASASMHVRGVGNIGNATSATRGLDRRNHNGVASGNSGSQSTAGGAKCKTATRLHLQASPECSLVIHVNGPRPDYLRQKSNANNSPSSTSSATSSSASTSNTSSWSVVASRAVGGSSALQAAQRALASPALCNTVAGALPPVLSAVYLPQKPVLINGKDEKMDHEEDHHRILVTFGSHEEMMKVKRAVDDAGVGSTEDYRDPVVRGQISTTIWLHSQHIHRLLSELQGQVPAATFTLAPLDRQELGRTIFFQIPARQETQLLQIPREWAGLPCRIGLMVKIRDRQQHDLTACRRCFSTEHLVSSCPVARDAAPCAVCGQTGHRSQECPRPHQDRRCLICKESHSTLRCPSINPKLCSLDRNRLHRIKDKMSAQLSPLHSRSAINASPVSRDGNLSQSGSSGRSGMRASNSDTESISSLTLSTSSTVSNCSAESSSAPSPTNSSSSPTYASVLNATGVQHSNTSSNSSSTALHAQYNEMLSRTQALWDVIGNLRREVQERREKEELMQAAILHDRSVMTNMMAQIAARLASIEQTIATRPPGNSITPSSGKRQKLSRDETAEATTATSTVSASSTPAPQSSLALLPCNNRTNRS